MSITSPLNNGSCLLSSKVRLFSGSAVLRVGVCVKRHDLLFKVLLDELKRLSGGCIIAIYMRFFTEHGTDYCICVGADDVIVDVSEQLALVSEDLFRHWSLGALQLIFLFLCLVFLLWF